MLREASFEFGGCNQLSDPRDPWRAIFGGFIFSRYALFRSSDHHPSGTPAKRKPSMIRSRRAR